MSSVDFSGSKTDFNILQRKENVILNAMPVGAPVITRNECAVSGANLNLVNGLISDAGKIVAQAVEDQLRGMHSMLCQCAL